MLVLSRKTGESIVINDEIEITVTRIQNGRVRIGIAAELQTLVKNNIGVTSIVHVVEPETIERSMGKAKRIVDNRPK